MIDPYIRKAKIIRVVDGDTVDAVIDLGFNITTTHRLRLAYVNTPEKGQVGNVEATAFTASLLLNKDVILRSTKSDKYGRYLAEIFLDDGKISFNNLLLEEGLAVLYK